MNKHKFLFFDADKAEESAIKNLIGGITREGHVVEVENNSLEAAKEKVKEIHEGNDYDCIFIARDLSGFVPTAQNLPSVNIRKLLVSPRRILDLITGNTPDAAGIPETNIPFGDICQAFDNGKKMGDFIYLLLRQQGVPQEKLFLYGVDSTSGIADILTLKGVNFIDLQDNTLFGNGGAPLNINSKYKTVKSICGACEEARVYYRYKHIFGNLTHPKLQPLYDKIDKFISLLARMESGEVLPYNNVADGAAVVLRTMTEEIVRAYGGDDVRNLLNQALYNKHPYPHPYSPNGCHDCLPKGEYINLVRNGILYLDHAVHQSCSVNDKKIINSGIRRCVKPGKTQQDFYDDFNRSVMRLLLYYMNVVGRSGGTSTLPKYVFSCIDNIYTVTSECSIHSGAHTKFNQPQDQVAWRLLLTALFNNMLTVLDYITRFPPR